MSIVIKVVAIVLAVVVAVAVIGTLVGVGVNMIRFMVNQHLPFGDAFHYSWDAYVEWLQKINPIKVATAYDECYNMVNKNIPVVACVSL